MGCGINQLSRQAARRGAGAGGRQSGVTDTSLRIEYNHCRKVKKMVRVKVFKTVVVVLFFSLLIAIGARFLPGPPAVSAARLFKYKVVTMGSANTVYEYEKLLNDMAYQGWEFDHVIPSREWAVFRK
jgi:hypothetical protein